VWFQKCGLKFLMEFSMNGVLNKKVHKNKTVKNVKTWKEKNVFTSMFLIML